MLSDMRIMGVLSTVVLMVANTAVVPQGNEAPAHATTRTRTTTGTTTETTTGVTPTTTAGSIPEATPGITSGAVPGIATGIPGGVPAGAPTAALTETAVKTRTQNTASGTTTATTAKARRPVRLPAVAARSAYLIDSTGTVHFAKQAGRRVPVASLTKIMTSYVVLRDAQLDDVVTITKSDVRHAVANGAARAGLRRGERLTVQDLLHGLMLPSGADAAHALARVYGPRQHGFVRKMNAAARELGLTDTRYANADGLPSSGYSTAADQVTLTRISLRNPTFRTIVAKQMYRTGKHTWYTTNRLFNRTEGVMGVKTGFTNAAGFCLAFAAKRAGRRVIGVLLGDGDSRRFTTAAALLDYADARISLWDDDNS